MVWFTRDLLLLEIYFDLRTDTVMFLPSAVRRGRHDLLAGLHPSTSALAARVAP